MKPRKKSLTDQLARFGQAVSDAKILTRDVCSRYDEAMSEVERIGEARVSGR